MIMFSIFLSKKSMSSRLKKASQKLQTKKVKSDKKKNNKRKNYATNPYANNALKNAPNKPQEESVIEGEDKKKINKMKEGDQSIRVQLISDKIMEDSFFSDENPDSDYKGAIDE